MIFGKNTLTLKEASVSDLESMTRKLTTSKLKSLRGQLDQLIQKKIRIDLEIRSLRKKISKMKTESQNIVKARVSLENLDYDSFSQEDHRILLEAVGPEVYQELFDLDEQVELVQTLLDKYEDIPLCDQDILLKEY